MRPAASSSRPADSAAQARKPPTLARWSHTCAVLATVCRLSSFYPAPSQSTGIDIPHGQTSAWLGARVRSVLPRHGRRWLQTSTRTRSGPGHVPVRASRARSTRSRIRST